VAVVGGEELTSEHVAILKSIDTRIRVFNEYGPTEAAVGCIVKEVDCHGAVTVGTPISNVRAYVLDDRQRLCAVGIRGEICVAGASVARGYRNQPELTASRFLRDPFNPGQRLYRTGDSGRSFSEPRTSQD
jgi:non-ribosomal peptide synthetase component F